MTDSAAKKTLIGSYLTPELSKVMEFVAFMKNNCSSLVSKKGKSLVEAHNAMALYTQQMLAFATEHRAVSDPFFDLCTFDVKNRTVLIEDKVVSSAHQTRIAWLPPQAISQLENYIAHLRSLSRYIRPQNSILANQIWAVTEPDYPHPIPLFFFLQEKDGEMEWIRIQPSTLKAMLGSAWILPLNSNRHLLSSWLHENNCPSEVIDAQLGHIEAGCSPFSARSPLAPEVVAGIVISLLEAYLKEQGWSEVEGLSAPSRFPVCRPSINSKHLKASIPFGPKVRSANRENTLQNDTEAVLTLFKEKFSTGTPDVIPDADVDSLQDIIKNKSADGRVLIRLSLFRRHLLKLKRAGKSVKIPGRLALANKEPSCFDTDSSRAASITDEIGNRFLSYLSSKAWKGPSIEMRIAEILISSCIFGAQSSPRFLDTLATGLGGRINRIDGELIVDIYESAESPIRRWMPDKVSCALLLGYWKSFDQNQPAPSAEKVSQSLDEILQLIKAPRQKIKSRGKKSKIPPAISELLLPLIQLSRHRWRFRLPGVIRAYAEGEIPCASVPLSNWLRLVTGESGTLNTTPSTLPTTAPCDDIQPIKQFNQAGDFKQAMAFWDEINKAFGPSPRNKGTGKTDARSNAKKGKVESRIHDLLNDKSKVFPPIGGLVAAWVIHLCRNGTIKEPDLAASSVITYGRTIGNRLISLAYEFDFLALSDLQIEAIYRDVLASATVNNRAYVAKRVKNFHAFLISTYAMPAVDWSEVIDEDLVEAEAVDAGIVTTEEYGKALDILLKDPSHPDFKQRLRHAAILFFGYRFGLRTGEIIRLTISDVILQDGEMVVYIRNSVHGETKTDNGVRQLPLIGKLSEVERDLVTMWLAHVETYADNDNLAALFSKLSGKRDLADRSESVRVVVEALRAVTGDQQIRLRHLRHTCATRLFLAMILDNVPFGRLGDIYRALWDDVSPKDVRDILIGNSRLSRRGLYAMALFMGHASPDVTHRHYVHLADIVLKEWIVKETVNMDDKALAYAFQTSYDNMRQVRSRLGKGASLASLASLSEYFMRKSTIPTPKLQSGLQHDVSSPTTLSAQSTLTPADVDRLLAIATLRDSIDGLADRFLTTNRIVTSTLLSASMLQERTGFADFAIPQTNPDDPWVFKPASRGTTLDKESQRVRVFLEAISKSAIDSGSPTIASQIWIDAYHPHKTYLLITKRSDLVALLDAMKEFGISPADLDAIIPANPNKDEPAFWEPTEKYLKSLGLPVRQDKRLSHSSEKTNSNSRIGLILQSEKGKKHQLGYQRTLNRALFIIAVWASLPTLDADQFDQPTP